MLKENWTMKQQKGINKENKKIRSYQKKENKRVENLQKKPKIIIKNGRLLICWLLEKSPWKKAQMKQMKTIKTESIEQQKDDPKVLEKP